jgi:hypothetical protein
MRWETGSTRLALPRTAGEGRDAPGRIRRLHVDAGSLDSFI